MIEIIAMLVAIILIIVIFRHEPMAYIRVYEMIERMEEENENSRDS